MQNTNQIPESRKRKPAKTYEKSSFVDIYKGFQTLLKGEFFCDIKLKTDDKKIITAHKVILSAASPYFRAIFTNRAERNHDLVAIRCVDYTALQLLINFIYSGKIVITNENVQNLLTAVDILELKEVEDACCDFLQSQLCPTNCIGINAIADLHGCTKLRKRSELYILQHFSDVIGGDEFLSSTFEQVMHLISSDKLIVPSEEKVFESVITWVKHDLKSRECILPRLMEHVRLALTSNDYIRKKVAKDTLIKNCLECKRYVFEALKTLKGEELITQSIRSRPRHEDKVILVVGGIQTGLSKTLEYFDPMTEKWHFGPELITNHRRHSLVVIKDNLVFDVGGYEIGLSPFRCVHMLDITENPPHWQLTNDLLVERQFLGVGVINDNIYAADQMIDMKI
ncbi:kelch-like protein 2 isoform X2 [Acyrthosiphon pisum]|uniref:BTB domain-containing protein n=1 Tax=Acyrthosiphon pisum TaxID=7029 RepID=A0A8R2H763_ACYPI|nr:kelch-like protein 2 isoform X2 [Acyrthosiphon pisum]|eukprot:XP_016659013.1 PREDICTED: kelch-like protein 2 isoform X2 [Acyrthosiphon pisum]